MNSADKVMKNRARKIHSDQKPRRLRRKASSRRRVSGVIRQPTNRSGAGGASSAERAVIPGSRLDRRCNASRPVGYPLCSEPDPEINQELSMFYFYPAEERV